MPNIDMKELEKDVRKHFGKHGEITSMML